MAAAIPRYRVIHWREIPSLAEASEVGERYFSTRLWD